jgi:hypothetical protein
VFKPGTYFFTSNKEGGDLDRHLESEKPTNDILSQGSNNKLTDFILQKGTDIENSVLTAESVEVYHVVKHELTYQ